MTDEQLLSDCMSDASHALSGVESLAAAAGGLQGIADKLGLIASGSDDVVITRTEAAMLSWAVGASTYLSLAAKLQNRIRMRGSGGVVGADGGGVTAGARG